VDGRHSGKGELAVTQEDIIKKYHPNWQDCDPTQKEYKGYAALAISGRLAQTALAGILVAGSNAEGCEAANEAIEAPKKFRECSDDIPSLDEAAAVEKRNPSSDQIKGASGTAFRETTEKRASGLAETQPQQRPSTRIAFKANGRIVFIDSDDVVAVESKGNYVSLQRRSDSHLLRESISVVAEMLKPLGFVRIHRSVLVNSSFVQQIYSRPGAYALRTKGGKEYTVTRTYRNNLKSLAAAWIGTDISFEE
jgi:DNA-binding LytR/AlgR family response regulator